jgi:regulator of sigma E protease
MLQYAQIALTYTLPFLAVLTLVVTVHELGHFLVARAFGVAVDRFSVGFGPAIVSWRDKHATEWRLSWIPLGGYVKFSGDENIASVPDLDDLDALRKQVLSREGPRGLKRYFHFKPLWQRALVMAAGPAANFVLAIAVFSALAMTLGEPHLNPRVGQVPPGSPAALAGFRTGDLVLSADGRRIGEYEDLYQFVLLHAGNPIRFEVDRGGKTIQIVATPMRRTKADDHGGPVGLGYLGIGPSQLKSDFRLERLGPVGALDSGVKHTGDIVGMSLTYIGRMVTGQESGSQLSGMLGMAGRTGHYAAEATKDAPDLGVAAAQLGLTMIQVAAFISVALGFANLLPIPVLDGGHLLFYGYEAVARRPLAAKVQDAGYRVGFALVIALMLFVTFNDLNRFGLFQFISGLFS